jgi:hypothetical protein
LLEISQSERVSANFQVEAMPHLGDVPQGPDMSGKANHR